MSFLVGIVLIVLGYYNLFNLDAKIDYSDLILKVRMSQSFILVGSFLILFYIYRKL